MGTGMRAHGHRYAGLWAQVCGLMGPDMRAYGPRHAGRDKVRTIFTKDTKEKEML